MARFNDQEVAEKAADIYAEAENHYKGSEINTSTLMSVAKEYFNFDEEQLQQLGEYFEWEELSFIPLDNINLDALQYVDPEQVKAAIENRDLKGIEAIESFLTNAEGYNEEAKAILSQLLTTFKGLTQKEESLEEEKEIVEEDTMPSNDELPDMCYVYVESDNCIGIVKKGEVGYYPATNVDPNLTEPEQKRQFVNERNAILDIDERTMEIMKTKSMFGWGDKKEEGIIDELPEEDVKTIIGIDQMISDLQSKHKLQVTGSYTDDAIELSLKGDTLPLIDAMDYIKGSLEDKAICNFSDKVNDTIVCTITK